MPLLILFSILVIIPMAEITVLLHVSDEVGPGLTILLVIATAMLGAFLVKQQGFHTMRNAQSQLAEGKMPAMQIAEGMALLIAGALLLTPGFITDTIGFFCLTPPLRRAAIHWLGKNGIIQAERYQQTTSNHRSKPNKVIEGEYKSRD